LVKYLILLRARVASDLQQDVVEFGRATDFNSPRNEIIFGFNNKQIYSILEIYAWDPAAYWHISLSVSSE